MKRIAYPVLITVLMLFFIHPVKAVKASPEPIKIKQADGSEITIRLNGDEFFHYKTSMDGYTLIPNAEGILTYAQLNETGKLISTNVKASDIKKRSSTERQFIKELTPNLNFQQKNSVNRAMRAAAINVSAPKKAFPLTGSGKSLVILVNFKDVKFVTSNPKVAYTNLLNQAGYSTNGGTGSAKDYFRDNSMGVFNPQFDVVGPFDLPNNMAYYGKNDAADDDNDTNPRQMVIDACSQANINGVDFSQYDTDKDGLVDNIFIYYAGFNEAEGGSANSVWPHRWTLANYSTVFDNVTIFDYACTSELRSNTGTNMCGIGTFVHEFGHVLGLPDYYATNGAKHQTLSYWSVMDAGPYLNKGRTPPAYSAYDRFYLNWLTPIELKVKKNVVLDTLTTSNKAYIFTQNGNHNLSGSNPSPTEFFTVENRQNKGWDAYLPGHGLLLTRINYNSSSWANNAVNNTATSMGVDIMEADGIASDENLAGDVFPGTSKITAYNPTLRSGIDIKKPLNYITEVDGIIKFRFMGGDVVPTVNVNQDLTQFSTVVGTPSIFQMISIAGTRLESNIELRFSSNIHFEMRKATETDNDWRKSITLTQSNSIVNATQILIRYNPTQASFKDLHNETLIISTDNADEQKFYISGKSTRPVYVVTPIATDATDVTYKSFIANWNPVSDASGYYLTVYGLGSGASQITEEFNNGLTAPAGWTISATSATSTSTYSGNAIPAIEFAKTGDYLKTQEHVIPVIGFSFFIKSRNESAGVVKLEAWNGSLWKEIENVSISNSLSTTKNYTFTKTDNYLQFRLSYTKGFGSAIIDDVVCKFENEINYLATNKWVTANKDTLVNLVSNRTYFYKVKATDKTLDIDNTIKYENITDFSNIVEVKTKEDTDYKVLRANKQSDGSVMVILPNLEENVQIFNLLGQKLEEIVPTGNVLNFSNLKKGQVYIFKAGKRVSKVIL